MLCHSKKSIVGSNGGALLWLFEGERGRVNCNLPEGIQWSRFARRVTGLEAEIIIDGCCSLD